MLNIKHVFITLALVVLVGGIMFYTRNQEPTPSTITVASFEECAAAGFPIMESYPRQCRTPEGELFVEEIGNELEKTDLIRVTSPRPNAEVSSPIAVEGEARGYWYFEASFPIKVLDANETMIGQSFVQADGEWMTENFVPFKTTIAYSAPTTDTGTLVLQKDNPSGLPENDDELRIPIKFIRTTTSPSTGSGSSTSEKCVVSGCSGQICAEEEMMSTCEYRAEYACYKTATCEKQSNGKCGWTQTSALKSCLNASAEASVEGNTDVQIQ